MHGGENPERDGMRWLEGWRRFCTSKYGGGRRSSMRFTSASWSPCSPWGAHPSPFGGARLGQVHPEHYFPGWAPLEGRCRWGRRWSSRDDVSSGQACHGEDGEEHGRGVAPRAGTRSWAHRTCLGAGDCHAFGDFLL